MLKERLIKEAESRGAECAFVIKDLKSNQGWKYRDELPIKAASLIKVFILTEAMRRIKNGQLALDSEIDIKEEDIVPFSVLEFLKPRKYTLEELLKLMIVYSDNTATNVFIEQFGMEAINDCIKYLGFKKSLLQRKMMDSEAPAEGRENYITPEEMAEFMERLYEGKLFDSEFDEIILEIMKGQSDETMMREFLPDEIIIARKSGELDCLDHDIAIVYGEKTDYIYCYFVWNAKSNNEARLILGETSKIVYDFFEDK